MSIRQGACQEGWGRGKMGKTNENEGNKMTKKIPAALRFLPALAWYALIFWFSSKTAAASGGQSSGLLGRLLDAASPSYGASGLQAFAVETLSFPVRKAAHMFLYFVLALLLLHALTHLKRRGPWKLSRSGLLTPALCAALAALDEYHQTLVPGRSGEPRDVLVDLCGAILALGLWALVFRSRRKPVPVGQTAPVWVVLPPFLLLAALILFPQWAGPAAAALAERYTEGFSSLDAAAKAALLEGAAPVFREAMAGAACGLLGAWGWIAACLAGWRVPAALGAPAVALAAALLGALPLWTAALAAGAGCVLTAALWGFILLLGGRDPEGC